MFNRYIFFFNSMHSMLRSPGNTRHFAHHASAFLHAAQAALRTFLTMRMVMLPTLFGAPLAYLGAEMAILLHHWAFSLHCREAKAANFDAFPAAFRAIVVTGLAGHSNETGFAIGDTLPTGFDTFLVIHVTMFKGIRGNLFMVNNKGASPFYPKKSLPPIKSRL